MAAPQPTAVPKWMTRMGAGVSPAQKGLFVTVGVGIAAVVFGIQGIFLPWQNERQQLQNQQAEETERLSLLSMIQSKLAELKTEEARVLATGGTSSLTNDATRLASQAGLKVESVTPQAESSFGPYKKLQIQITAMADFWTLLKFLQLVETHEPFLKLDDLIAATPIPQQTSQQKLVLWISRYAKESPTP